MLLEGNELLHHTYKIKKILCPMGIDYKKIHICRNDCILYKKVYKNLNECPKFGASHYKLKEDGVIKTIRAPMLWYLLIMLQCYGIF